MSYSEPIYANPDPTIKALASAAFPGYRGRTFRVMVHDDAKVELHNTYWDGGSRCSYSAVTLSDHPEARALPHFNPPQFGGPTTTPVVDIPLGAAIVEHAIFCGSDMGLTFHVRADGVAALIPETGDVSDDEKIVCAATAQFKNTYSGRTGIRFEEAQHATGITRERWDAAFARCVERGFLRKNGAITPDGRNAARGFRL